MTTVQAHIDFKNKLGTIYEAREAENITDWVFENVTGLKKWEIRNNQIELKGIFSDQLKNYLQELLQHKPVQYVLHEAWFYKRKFYVDENSLIPRPETEELVAWIVEDFRSEILDSGFKKDPNSATETSYLKPETLTLQILDIGAGSGCIAISLKKELPFANVTAIDINQNVEKVIKQNSQKLNAEIDFLQFDFLNEPAWNELQHYDIIVSNPPYIPLRKKETLANNVTRFEPAVALFVPDTDPFIFYEKIAGFSKSHLNEFGKIYVEVHEDYANDVKNIFESAGFTSLIKKDIYKKERMIKCMKI